MPVYIKFVRVVCLVTSFLLFTTLLRAQEISGKVVDAESGKPIIGASVYLNGTYKGTSSNKEGSFIINSIERNIPLIVSYVGYESQTISNYSGKNLNIQLKHKANELKEVTIDATGVAAISREEEMKIFLREFIGTKNRECAISNPGDISFIYRKKTEELTAAANEPLVIYNKKLGYKITYFLSSFKYTPHETSFLGNYFFAEDTESLKPNELKRILRARDDGYYGSRMHFIRSLWANNLDKEKFTLQSFRIEKKSDTTNITNMQRFVQQTVTNSFHPHIFYKDLVTTHDGQKFIKLDTLVDIGYKSHTSNLAATAPGQETLIAANGFYDPNILWSGFMGSQRVGELLPYEFEPSNQPPQEDNAPVQTFTHPKVGDPGLAKLLDLQDSLHKRLPIEKLYVQLDKPYYNLGDTLRFKSYLLNADFLTPSVRSGLLYVELDGATGNMVKRIMVPVSSGLSWGDIALDEDEVPEGSYTLRAYTNWMRNFGEDYVFKKDIYISKASNASTLVKADFKLTDDGTKDKVQASLRFTGLNKQALGLRDMQLRVMNGTHTITRGKVTTGMDGTLAINFDLADKTALKNLSIQAQQTGLDGDTSKLTIPITINRVENTDLQFMPEGGSLVAGITNKIGFKAIGEDGKGTDINGTIYNSKEQEVVKFKSVHKGMGSFELQPQLGETYTAKISLPNGIVKAYPVPQINLAGTTLKVISKVNDSLEVAIENSSNLAGSRYYLIGQSRGVVCYAARILLKNEKSLNRLSVNTFPTGIAHFTLLNSAYQPVNERIVYIDHRDNLNIRIIPSKQSYTARDSIALNIEVTDKTGEPVQGNFSLAVTDNGQIKTDSLSSSIVNNLLFTSDLKGTIEDPNYYLTANTPEKATALDNLMLTQGWIGYDWKQISDPKTKPIEYIAEPEFTVQGKITNVLGKPVEKSGVTLYSKKPFIIKDTQTGKDGIFTFKGFMPVDTAAFLITSRNKAGKSFNVGVEILNEFKPPVFAQPTRQQIPWYVNSDTVLLNNSHTKIAQLKADQENRGEGHQLKEVVINEKKVVKGSENLNGPGEADQVLDEKDMLKAQKMTLGQLLEQKIKGFRIFGSWTASLSGAPIPYSYLIYDKKIVFVMDGMLLDYVPREMNARYDFLKVYMDYYTAEDIKGIEIMYNLGYNGLYSNKFTVHEVTTESDSRHKQLMASQGVTPASPDNQWAFIEITTRTANGPFMKATPGTYLYKPLPFTLPKDFYRPRYIIKNNTANMGADLRSTIHWEPNVVTDKDGKATVSFYVSDRPNNYTVIIEGSDMNGNIGSVAQKLKPTKNTP
jgi:hypothetical protein